MNEIHDLALSLGKALGRTHEYRTLARASESADEDREIVTLKNQARRLEEAFQSAIGRGEEPPDTDLAEYEVVAGKLQASSVYQSLVAAQANFDRVMAKVDASIQEGMREGASSRIILSS